MEKEKQERDEGLGIGYLLRQLEELVQLSMDATKQELKPDFSFVTVHKQLMDIKQQLEGIKRFFVDAEGREIIPKGEDLLKYLNPEDKKIMERILKMEKECQEIRDNLQRELREHPSEVRDVQTELQTDKKKKAKRKSRYKTMGDDGWLRT